MAAGANPLEHVIQHSLKTVEADLGPLTPNGEITVMSDHISMILLAGFLLMLILPPVFRRRKATDPIQAMVPSGFRNGLEAICQYLRKEVAQPALGEHTDRFIKYIWTVFFFVLTMNLLGLVPIGSLTPLAFDAHIGGTATANIWVTGTLALTTVVMIIFNGLRLGGVDYVKHLMPGPMMIKPLMFVIEVIGIFAKGFALAVRLFANMVAGHTLMAVLLGFILSAGSASAVLGFGIAVPVVLGSVAISMLELFVAFLQAFIFTFLSTLFIGMSVMVHGDDHQEAHG